MLLLLILFILLILVLSILILSLLILLLIMLLFILSLLIFILFCSGSLIGTIFISFFKGIFGIISIHFGSILLSDSFFISHILINESLPELANRPSSNSITLYIFPL